MVARPSRLRRRTPPSRPPSVVFVLGPAPPPLHPWVWVAAGPQALEGPGRSRAPPEHPCATSAGLRPQPTTTHKDLGVERPGFAARVPAWRRSLPPRRGRVVEVWARGQDPGGVGPLGDKCRGRAHEALYP